MQDNIQAIIQEMAQRSGKGEEEINELVQAKISKFSGLLTEQGAVYMVQKELGVGKEALEEIQIGQLTEGMKGIEIKGTIETIYPVKEFEKSGKKGKLKSFILSDPTGEVRVTLWNDQVEKYELTRGSEIKIANVLISNYNEKKQATLGFNGTIEILNKKEESFEKLSDLKNAMNGINVNARIIRKFPCKEFEGKERKGKLCSFQISDGSANIRATAWNEKANEIEKYNEGEAIEIKNAYTKEGMRGIELHLGYSATINTTTKTLPSNTEMMKEATKEKKISEILPGENAIISGNIIGIEKGNIFYEVCTKCNKKITKTINGNLCENCGETTSKKNAVISAIIKDESGEIKTTLFRENALKFVEESQEELEKKVGEKGIDVVLAELNGKLIGKTTKLLGYTKTNQFSGASEFMAREVI
jgi:replication factor A1